MFDCVHKFKTTILNLQTKSTIIFKIFFNWTKRRHITSSFAKNGLTNPLRCSAFVFQIPVLRKAGRTLCVRLPCLPFRPCMYSDLLHNLRQCFASYNFRQFRLFDHLIFTPSVFIPEGFDSPFAFTFWLYFSVPSDKYCIQIERIERPNFFCFFINHSF